MLPGLSSRIHYRCQRQSRTATELYDPKTFIVHAALLHQAFAHCARFPTAAFRRSLDRVSVPMWPITLSGRLLIVTLVSRYRKEILRSIVIYQH